MGQLHSKMQGISRSANPQTLTATMAEDITLGCRGACVQISEEGPDTISNWGHIARFLRYPCRQAVTGSKILRLLKKNGLAPEIPEDLYMLIKKACLSASTWSAIAQTKIQNFASSSSSRVSIASRVTIGPRASLQLVILEVLVVHL